MRDNTGEGHVETETETGMMQPRESWQPPKTGRRKDSPLESLEEVWRWQHLDFGILFSRTVREYIFCFFKPPSL